VEDAVELPEPGTPELLLLIPDDEARHIYEFLFVRRDNPPTMVEIRQHIEKIYGEPHAQTDRRQRDLKDKHLFDVRTETVKGRGHVYRLVGRRAASEDRSARKAISGRVRAEVLTTFKSRCAMCGKNPKDDGVKLVIDHIVPLDWGGTNKVENLQPLCEECNSGKKAHYSSFDSYGDAIRRAISLPDAHSRIGELLKAMQGKPVRSDLIALVAREENRGDYLKRLRELRYSVIGWKIESSKKKEGKRTHSFYTCRDSKPFPEGGAKKAIARHEAERKRGKANPIK
jgi:5-methylcytosine-specific restriction endonuclease McrA